MALTIKRPETRVSFCLDGDLQAAYEAADAEFANLSTRKLIDERLNGQAKESAQRLVELEAQMQESTVSFVLRGMPRGEWGQLTAEHGPKEGNTTDKHYGYNMEAVMTIAIPKSIVGVENSKGERLPFNVTDEWEALAADMTDAQYEDFVLGVLKVNKGRSDVPLSLSAFRMMQDSEQK
jgi:hypothetical protein